MNDARQKESESIRAEMRKSLERSEKIKIRQASKEEAHAEYQTKLDEHNVKATNEYKAKNVALEADHKIKMEELESTTML